VKDVLRSVEILGFMLIVALVELTTVFSENAAHRQDFVVQLQIRHTMIVNPPQNIHHNHLPSEFLAVTLPNFFALVSTIRTA